MGEVERVTESNRSGVVAAVVTGEQESKGYPLARLIELKPDAIIPVHLDTNGIPKEDISEEWPCALNRAYFIKKNLRLYNLMQESGGGYSALEFQVFPTSSALNVRENMFVELFLGRGECVLLKVSDTYDCSNSDSGTWTITCEGASINVSQIIR